MSVTSRKQRKILNWVLDNQETIGYVFNRFIFTDDFDRLPMGTRSRIAGIRKEFFELDFKYGGG